VYVHSRKFEDDEVRVLVGGRSIPLLLIPQKESHTESRSYQNIPWRTVVLQRSSLEAAKNVRHPVHQLLDSNEWVEIIV
jgi:hypothetical protein